MTSVSLSWMVRLRHCGVNMIIVFTLVGAFIGYILGRVLSRNFRETEFKLCLSKNGMPYYVPSDGESDIRIPYKNFVMYFPDERKNLLKKLP